MKRVLFIITIVAIFGIMALNSAADAVSESVNLRQSRIEQIADL